MKNVSKLFHFNPYPRSKPTQQPRNTLLYSWGLSSNLCISPVWVWTCSLILARSTGQATTSWAAPPAQPAQKISQLVGFTACCPPAIPVLWVFPSSAVSLICSLLQGDCGVRCSTILPTCSLLSHFCQFPNSQSKNSQRSDSEQPKSKSTQPYSPNKCPSLYSHDWI